ncbi:MAG: four helix bundle protein [Lentisphaeria bacterium]|jgi:four helix bundle protein
MPFDHEKLDVYQVALQFAAWAHEQGKSMAGYHAFRDQLWRASYSIVLNIAEGNGKRSTEDRKRFLEIARGSCFECAACIDIATACGLIMQDQLTHGKAMADRIAAMLTKMTA